MQFPVVSDGSTHVVFDPLVLIERLAALVPRPRKHLTTYHGVFAPNASYRDRIVPPPPDDDEPPPPCALSPRAGQHRPRTEGTSVPHVPKPRQRRRYTWAQLMLRCFGIDVLVCPECGGRRQLLTFLTHPPTIARILEHLGLPTSPPEIAPARAPPEAELPFTSC